MQVTLIAIKRTPRVSKKTGKPFVSVGIQTDKHGSAWLSGFASVENEAWKEGDTVDIDVEQNNEYLNFKIPQKKDSGPAAGNAAASELKNILTLSVLPKLDKILTWIDKQNNLDPQAIDDAINSSPF